MDIEFPLSSRELITILEKKYPPRCMTLDESVAQHQRYAGAVSLVEALKTWQQMADEGEE